MGSFFHVGLALLVVLSLMGLLKIALRRQDQAKGLSGLMGTLPARRMQVIETLPIGIQHRVVLLRVDTAEHLVIIGPNGQTELQHIQKNPEQMT